MADLVQVSKRQFQSSYVPLVNLTKDCPDELWSTKAGGFVYWQQLLHTFTGINFWLRTEGVDFIEPFPGYKVYPELDGTPEINLTKEQVGNYTREIDRVVEQFFLRQTSESLLEASWIYDKITSLDVLLGQIRHIQYHVGHCEALLRERGCQTQKWLDFSGEET